MSKSILFAALVAMTAVGGSWWYAGHQTASMTPLVTAASAEDAVAPATTAEQATVSSQASKVPDMILGKADAPVTVVEYASFTCPHCANFHVSCRVLGV